MSDMANRDHNAKRDREIRLPASLARGSFSVGFQPRFSSAIAPKTTTNYPFPVVGGFGGLPGLSANQAKDQPPANDDRFEPQK